MENLVTMLTVYKNRKVFITGHTGFKGSWLSAFLNFLGAEQVGFSKEPNTNPSHFEILKPNNISIIGDILDAAQLNESISKFQPEILFHLAAQPLVRESYKNPTYTYETNVIGTLNVLEAVRNCPSVKAVVIITTDKVYENKEWLFPYRENDELGGYDIYSSSKACTEILVKSYQRSFFNLYSYKNTHHTLIATVRAGNVIGGGDWSVDRLVPDIIKATIEKKATKIRNPDSVRPWQHVLDCLHGYLLLGEKLLKEETDYANAWNFAPYSFESMKVKEVAGVAKTVWEDINIVFERIPNDLHEANILKLDNSKATSLLGWRPTWDSKTAIKKTIEWYKEYYLNNQVLTYTQIQEFCLANGIY